MLNLCNDKNRIKSVKINNRRNLCSHSHIIRVRSYITYITYKYTFKISVADI